MSELLGFKDIMAFSLSLSLPCGCVTRCKLPDVSALRPLLCHHKLKPSETVSHISDL